MPFANITKKKILNSKKILLKYKNQIGAKDKKVFEQEFKKDFSSADSLVGVDAQILQKLKW